MDGWYHDFEALGIKTGPLHPNQRCKQQNLFNLIDRAVSLCKNKTQCIRGVELFCSDGFYAQYAIKGGASLMFGIDKNRHYISKARLITKILGNSDKIRFACRDVFDIKGIYDLCICAGGLYHLSNPHELLHLLADTIEVVLVIQTVYSLAKTHDTYFEIPAPGWAHGCRFSLNYLLKMVEDSGWKILDKTTNQLEGNKRLDDRGSAYLLCVPTKKRTN
jgi:hypothetical protein